MAGLSDTLSGWLRSLEAKDRAMQRLIESLRQNDPQQPPQAVSAASD
jgi:hypothetical protein